jgi:hypothetical protein
LDEPRFVRLLWLLAGVWALLSAPAAAAGGFPAVSVEVAPRAGSVVSPSAPDGEDDVSEGELPFCDLADMSVPLAPGACSVTPVNDAPATPSNDAVSSSAPMCDPSAASIAAAVEIPEVDRGRLQPWPCDAERLLFWPALHLAGFTDVRLRPEDERRLLEYGCGITAVVERPTQSTVQVPPEEFRQARAGFEAKMRLYAPRAIAFP